MTAIAAIAHDGTVRMGADSAATDGTTLRLRKDEKVFTAGPWVVGFAASWRFGQLLRYRLAWPDPPVAKPLHEWLCTGFTDQLRECLAGGGWAGRDKDGRESGGSFLLGVSGQLFEVTPSFQVAQPAERYAAIGCGRDLALGSLYSTEGSGISPEERLAVALEAAERFSAGVRRPWCIRMAGGEGA